MDRNQIPLGAQQLYVERRSAPMVGTICGSMRFFDRMLEVAQELSLRGHIVLAPFVRIPPAEQGDSWVKYDLDALHLRKIERSDYVYIVNTNGYVGDSTRREIYYANQRRLKFEFDEPVTAAQATTLGVAPDRVMAAGWWGLR